MPYPVRVIRWLPLGVATLVGAAIVAARRDGDAAVPLQAVSILLAGTAGFALDDPADGTMSASPTSLARRRIARVAIAAVPAFGVWVTLVAVQRPAGIDETGAITAMFAGLYGLALGIAGTVGRHTNATKGGLAAGPCLLLAVVMSSTMPPRWRPLPTGDIPGGWAAIELRWSIAAVVGLVAFTWSSRDPARA